MCERDLDTPFTRACVAALLLLAQVAWVATTVAIVILIIDIVV